MEYLEEQKRKKGAIERIKQAAKDHNFDIQSLHLNFEECSVEFLIYLETYIKNEKDVSHFIHTCETLFPNHPTDFMDIAAAVTVVDREDTAAVVKAELDAGRCELSQEGLIFESMYQKALREQKDTVFTNCGRLAYDDKYGRGIYQMGFFMSEGSKKAHKIYSNVINAYNCTHKELAAKGAMFGHLYPGYMLTLTMDDMNIRGQQLIYGWEYANHSAEVLAELLDNRDEDLIAYINKRTVEEYDNASNRHKNCLAVDGGASYDKKPLFSERPFGGFTEKLHTEYNPLIDDAEEIVSQCTKDHFEIDYASMDINRKTATEQAMKIAKAHGFELVYQGDIENSNLKSILMISKDGDALLRANAQEDGDMAYGGCDLYVVTDEGNAQLRQKLWNEQRDLWNHLRQNTECFGNQHAKENPYSNFRMRDCSCAEEGCFTQYQVLKQMFPVEAGKIPWDKAPVKGIAELPIPKTFDIPYIYHESQYPLLGKLYTELGMLEYRISEFINRVNFVREVLPKLPQEVKAMYVRYEKEPYKTIAECLSYFNLSETAETAGIALRYLNLPEEEEKLYLTEIKAQMIKYAKSTANSKEETEKNIAYANKQYNRIKEDTAMWDNVLKIMLPDSQIRESDKERELA